MKRKTSITLSAAALYGIERHDEFASRSEFIEAAVRHFVSHHEREEANRRDAEILGLRAEELNAEAEDALAYQVPL
jgi:metal-responsive CopG/Arc/MetJ family transcriptional regulator